MEQSMSAFTESVEEFVSASPWLSAEHAPALATLRAVAAELDGGELVPALVAQFGLTHRALAKERPTGEEQDPLAAALEEAGSA